ncbi:TIGR03085 family metal-binding protein [Dactylosporangium fulvum]|uniref:TIGR03085 family metal-binding protein n=1 Tax=Dactylosporangium fulvum TaxID=53359 RepID=A0ABY5VTE5_9ACTN|nr:TIGR03085 family metal-binding protein [Dactylosporangium fulvum]UWP81017.1 TIGR03085 family metal-binding protein [Dactylosporangium fulvum]
MSSFARGERAALADTLLAAGPDAPTLCTGWATRDLAAHLVLRERRPDAAPGILLKAVAGHAKKVQDGLAAGDYAGLVGKVRTPPVWLRPGFAEEAVNLIEFFIHHEDVRRATAGWTPRQLDPGYEAALSARVKGSAKLSTRRFPARIVVKVPGAEPFTVGRGGDAELVVEGAPGELLLFFTGRQRAAHVDVTGPDELADKLRGARLGL